MGVPSKIWRKVSRKNLPPRSSTGNVDHFRPTFLSLAPICRSYSFNVYSSRAFLHKCSMLWTVFAIQLIGVPATTSGKAGDIEVEIKVPKEVKVGSSIELRCEWRVFGGDVLYSVKWYKDDHEFFRYMPDDNPKIQTFSQPGINIDKRWSNEKSIRLRDVSGKSSGQYKCEVSTEAPLFATTYRAANLTVIVMPERGPEITGLSSHYSVGDNVTANCTSWPSVPTATLRWLVNGKPIAKEKTIEYPEYGVNSNGTASKAKSSVGLRLELQAPYLLLQGENGPPTTVAIRCIAQIGRNALQVEKLVAMAYVNNERLSAAGHARDGGARYELEPSRLVIATLLLLFT